MERCNKKFQHNILQLTEMLNSEEHMSNHSFSKIDMSIEEANKSLTRESNGEKAMLEAIVSLTAYI